jgi:hypothetical protein
VVDDKSFSERTVGKLPHQNGPRTPHVRLCHLDPRSEAIATVPAMAHRTHRKPVVWRARPELGGRRPSLTSRGGSQVPGALASAFIRAVVDTLSFRGLPMECGSTDRTNQRSRYRSRSTESLSVLLSAPCRAVDKSAPVPSQAVRLHAKSHTATATRRFNHNRQSTGSGTTLAVATGHGRNAIGIDIDGRNADLALGRVGPLMLTVEHISAQLPDDHSVKGNLGSPVQSSRPASSRQGAPLGGLLEEVPL